MDFSTKDDTATKHVLDYYKKYSQNKELPKYFSGTSLSYLPEIKDVKESESPETEGKTLVKADINIVVTTEDTENVGEPLGTSRASSAMSNHKLEWDSGADIGYHNCQEKRLKKSISLPIITDLKDNKLNFNFGLAASNVAFTGNQSSSTSSEGNVKVVLLTSSSSSEFHSDDNKKKEIYSSSSGDTVPKCTQMSISSSDSSNTQSLKQFASILSDLKQKIGLPGAHSTPKYMDQQKTDTEICSNTPVLKKSSDGICKNKATTSKSTDSLIQITSKDNCKKLTRKPSVLEIPHTSTNKEDVTNKKRNLLNSIVKYKNKKIVNLAVTKPITVECTCSNQSLTHKSLQTVRSQSTVAVQTDELNDNELPKTVQNFCKNHNNQSLIYFDYSESDKTKVSSTQTNSDVEESNCDSFEYLGKNPSQHSSSLSQKMRSVEGSVESEPKVSSKSDSVNILKRPTNLKKTEKSSDLRIMPREEASERSSQDDPLDNLGSRNVLLNIDDEIGKSVYVLQRLLKSKKYDSVTKKRYVKKIMNKIMESKYLEESSTSSELFIPKKVQKADSSGDRNENNPLQCNVPWYPVTNEQLKSSPRKRKLEQKTFIQDFLPEQRSSREEFSSVPEIVPINSRKNRFTLTNNEFSVNHGHEKNIEQIQSEKPSSTTNSTSLEKHYESSSTSSYQNWREDKTLSERIFEKQSDEKSPSSNGNGDCLVKFADRERQFQISWINNEISHLGKLKGLLEKPKRVDSKEQIPLNLQKTTNVYTVANENNVTSQRKRNYVIETLLGTQRSTDINFKLGDQVYTVHEFLNSKEKQLKKPRHVTGNIEVVSSNSTTNIKVTTFCEECKRSPCICDVVDEEDDCTCEQLGDCNLQCNCGSETCICRNNPPVKAASAPLPTKITEIKDSKSETCTSSSSSQSGDKNSCLCGTYKGLTDIDGSKDGLSGTFIPVTRPRSTVVKFSTYPSTSKKENERNTFFSSVDRPVDVVDKSTSAISKLVPLHKDQASSYGSLRKVFENCACTQTDCTCDFVEKLMNRFSKTDFPSSTTCYDKCLQTEKVMDKSVALQTHIDTHQQIQQTPVFTMDDKSFQTDNYADKVESETVGIQTEVDTVNQNEQTIIHGLNNYQNIAIQATTDVKDQILQTSRSVEEHHDVLKNSVATHISTNEETQTKAVSFVDGSASKSVETTPDSQLEKQKDATTSPTIHSVGTVVDNVIKQQDAATSPIINAANQLINQQESMVPQIAHSIGISAKHREKRRDVPVSEKNSHSDSSRPTSSSKSSTSDRQKRKVICLCCCTQTEYQQNGKSREKNVKVQTERNGADSDKENGKRKGDSFTTSSMTYEICPSILVSSYNDTSQSVSGGSSSKSTSTICVCCKEKYSPDKISLLGTKTENFPLCCNCLAKRPILTSVCYAGPEANCPCSKPSSREVTRAEVSDETKKTVTDSNDLDEYCTCTKPFQFKDSRYCSHCRYKLRNTARSKNGIAYTLTLEADCLNKIRRRRRKTPLEEIKLKVPSPSHKKKRKDKENVSKRDSDKERKCVCGRENVICVSNCHTNGVTGKSRKENKKNSLTLQEWLKKNRPDFIESAETRRHVVQNAKSERQIDQTGAKLRFAEENTEKVVLKKPRKLFTEQQMKEITKKHYKKLPEVKEKISNQREQRLRSADRFIMDVFARKIQHSVLKGKSSFPIDSNVICLPKTCNC